MKWFFFQLSVLQEILRFRKNRCAKSCSYKMYVCLCVCVPFFIASKCVRLNQTTYVDIWLQPSTFSDIFGTFGKLWVLPNYSVRRGHKFYVISYESFWLRTPTLSLKYNKYYSKNGRSHSNFAELLQFKLLDKYYFWRKVTDQNIYIIDWKMDLLMIL